MITFFIKGMLPFQNPDDMFLAIEEKKNAQSFAVLFKNVSSSKSLDYAISSMSNRASTATVYLNDKEVVGIKGLKYLNFQIMYNQYIM